MDEKQINILDFSVNLKIEDLLVIKQDFYKNEWTEDFEKKVNEIKNKTIINLENFILLPTYKFIPLTRIFKEEDLLIREEISKEVNKRFKNFKNEEN
jgi:hypothetical protein